MVHKVRFLVQSNHGYEGPSKSPLTEGLELARPWLRFREPNISTVYPIRH